MILLLIVVIYLYASIPFSLLVGLYNGIDIRQNGSENIGGSNLGRLCGKKAFIIGFILDGSKGAIVVLIANIFDFNPLILFPFALLGHALPIFTKFKGGKGVSTSFGFVLTYTFWLAIIAITIFLIILKLFKYVSLASMLSIFSYCILTVIFLNRPIYSLVVFSLCMVVCYLHKENIIRIKAKTEPKVSWI